MSVASLPMYDLPALRQATDDWWAGLARALAATGLDGVPQHLERQLGLDKVWRHPGLLISQTCGYPLTHALAGQVRVVATPAYGVEGCDGAAYRSVFVVRDDRVIFVPVEVGITGEKYFEVTGALEEGDQVVSGPFSAIRNLEQDDHVKIKSKKKDRENGSTPSS